MKTVTMAELLTHAGPLPPADDTGEILWTSPPFMIRHTRTSWALTRGHPHGFLLLAPFADDPSQRWQLTLQKDGYFRIVSLQSGLLMDVAGGSAAENAPVLEWQYTGGTNQQWNIVDLGEYRVRLVARHSRRVLEAFDVGRSEMAALVQRDWVDALNQHFELVDLSEGQESELDTPCPQGSTHEAEQVDAPGEQPPESGEPVSVQQAEVEHPQEGEQESMPMTERPLLDASRALIAPEALSAGSVSIGNVTTASFITSSGARGGRVVLAREVTTSSHWKIVNIVGVYYRIESPETGRVLTLQGESTLDNTRIIEWHWTGSVHQQWMIVPIGGGHVRILSRLSGKSLEPHLEPGAGMTELVQRVWSNRPEQHWLIVPVKQFSSSKELETSEPPVSPIRAIALFEEETTIQ